MTEQEFERLKDIVRNHKGTLVHWDAELLITEIERLQSFENHDYDCQLRRSWRTLCDGETCSIPQSSPTDTAK